MLLNTLATDDQIASTPSNRRGISRKAEMRLRLFACSLVQAAGVILKMPQKVMATAQVLLHRFYTVQSFQDHHLYEVSMGCMFLAGKLEETPRRLRDVINVFHYLRTKRDLPANIQYQPTVQFSNEYYDLRNMIIEAEIVILRNLAFQVHVLHPHGMLMCYLNQLELADNKSLRERTWCYLNDTYRTNVHVMFQPPTIACAVIYIAAHDEKVDMTTQPPWWEIFEASLDDMLLIRQRLAEVYVTYQKMVDSREWFRVPFTKEGLREYVEHVDAQTE